MGNCNMCCMKPSPSPSASPKLNAGSRQVKSKCGSKAHEAVRDTGAVETVPATPKSERLNSGAFKRHHLKNISAPVTAQEQDKRKNNDECPGRLTKEYRSCPVVFLFDDAIRQPDFKTTIQAVTLVIHYIIKRKVGKRQLDIFNEEKHPFRHEVISKDHFLHDPELETVYRFVCTLFSAKQLTAECVIVTLIFLERFLHRSNADMSRTSWRRILLGSALIAYEYWDKQALWGVDYCQLVNNIVTVEDMNEIEKYFLRFIQFDVKITDWMYATYYFDLLFIADKNNMRDLFEPFCKVEHRA